MNLGKPLLYVDSEIESKLPWLYVLLTKCPVNVVTYNRGDRNHVDLNQSKVLPFLVMNDTTVWGALSVLIYIAEKFASNVWYGQTVDERAKMNSILFWCGSTLTRSVLTSYVFPQTKSNYGLSTDNDNKDLVELGLRNTQQQLDILENQYLSSSKYMCGEKETIVDYYAALILTELEGIMFDFSKWPITLKWLTDMKTKIKTIFP